MTRDELIQKIDAAKREMEHAGPIHRRDLAKHIRRLEKELRFFDFSHRQAQKPHMVICRSSPVPSRRASHRTTLIRMCSITMTLRAMCSIPIRSCRSRPRWPTFP